ncbi:MBL fold metallo-hydrolase [Oceanobacillus luteolus]|uniref:MBL fold metallo-hydrolase n=1 Tax=Oceanobacillus luteolus TaxID=1274358 RepID=UPI00203FFEC0|nr:MBL fold metallo-hydrolase [Oceanobacillus luteolus]
MKVKKVSEHIWSLKIWVGFRIHVWLVVDKDGVTLVDAGISIMSNTIMKQIESLNAGPLKRILLTHGHADHVGAIKKIIKKFDVPVYAHRIEIPYTEGELPYPRRNKAQQLLPKELLQPLEEEENGVLLPIGNLKPYHTPGHSPGHVVYYHEVDRVLLAGDLFTTKKGELRGPISVFTADMVQAVESSTIIQELNPVKLEVCHGDSIIDPANQYTDYRKKMEKKYY